MGKGSWRRPNGPGFDENFCKVFPNSRGCERERVVQQMIDEQEAAKEERRQRADEIEKHAARYIVLSLDELRSIVFETSAAFCSYCPLNEEQQSQQDAEWSRTAALKDALERLGYTREAEMIGGAA